MYFFHRLLQTIAPQRSLTYLLGKVANSKWLAQTFIRWFIKRYDVNMAEAEKSNPEDFASFNAFFTRALKPGARVIDEVAKSIISPADGTLSEFGDITHGRVIQAKGQTFTVNEFLGGDINRAEPFLDGQFLTVYLSPKDYHRVHFPFDCTLDSMIYIPGKLFSVSLKTAQSIPRLFAKNERLCIFVRTEFGPAVIVLVGAMIVAGMSTVWGGDIQRESKIHQWSYPNVKVSEIHFKKGEQLGHFNLGSTVVVLCGFNAMQFKASLGLNSPIQMGQVIANITNA